MKTNKKAVAVFAVLSVLSGLGMGMAYAGEKTFNFDGRASGSFLSAEDFKPETAKPAKVAPQPLVRTETVFKIKAVIRNGSKVTDAQLACKPGQGGSKIADCKKQDQTAVSYEELNTLALRPYFSAEALKFADLLNQSKHSYTNQSGPMTFECHDTCANHDLVSIGFSTSFPYLEEFEVKCVEWTHECDCTAGC